uniref:Thymocyte expressed, positive selection associated 1 n=1 Tax=Coturnix japonica TaxID=93934 RepID=A0A8C2U9Z6_COTJA
MEMAMRMRMEEGLLEDCMGHRQSGKALSYGKHQALKKPQKKPHLVLCSPLQYIAVMLWVCHAQVQTSPILTVSPCARGSPNPPIPTMEGSSVLSPSSWERRRAWARQSRCWRTTVMEEEAAAAMQDIPELQPPHLDDVFMEGSSSSKIETWLQDCGSSSEALQEELSSLGPYGWESSSTSFEDDLTLGAEGSSPPWGSLHVPNTLSIHWGWEQPYGAADTNPVPKPPPMSPAIPCHFCASYLQPFCYRGMRKPSAGESWSPAPHLSPTSQPHISAPHLSPTALLCPQGCPQAVTPRAISPCRALQGRLSLGHSMASSAPSGLTNRTGSSISEVLDWCQADAEEILYDLGFVQSDPGALTRVPSRFFSSPSQAKGIDFQLFLKSQVQRLEMEDPCLMLASRFHQVQALAATADAFFCLYSYVSKTPLQRISPSPLTWTHPNNPQPHIPPSQPPTLSPAERLRAAVSKMCLYTPPLGRVVREVLERSRGERFRFDPNDVDGLGWGGGCGVAVGVMPHRGSSWLDPIRGHQGRMEKDGGCGQSSTGGGLVWGGGSLCPPGIGWGDTKDGQPWVNPPSTQLGHNGVPQTPPMGMDGGQHPGEPTDPHGALPPPSHCAAGGDQWGEQSRGWHRGGDAEWRPPWKGPFVGSFVSHHPKWAESNEAVDSFEMEEVRRGLQGLQLGMGGGQGDMGIWHIMGTDGSLHPPPPHIQPLIGTSTVFYAGAE